MVGVGDKSNMLAGHINMLKGHSDVIACHSMMLECHMDDVGGQSDMSDPSVWSPNILR